jgi:trehalose-6-phosphate synthase
MNLVAKEYVASRVRRDGVLVLSEFAGAARELEDAVMVNPYEPDGIADAVHRALEMSVAEQRGRMRALQAQVRRYDVAWWADRFIDHLAGAVGEDAATRRPAPGEHGGQRRGRSRSYPAPPPPGDVG